MIRRVLVAFSVLALGAIFALPASAQEAAKPPVMSHDAAGRDQCMMCHAEGGMKPVPASHEGRANEVCLMCHAADSEMQTSTPNAITHDLAGRDNCMMCHAAGGMKPVPASHEGRANEVCAWCHQPAAGEDRQ